MILVKLGFAKNTISNMYLRLAGSHESKRVYPCFKELNVLEKFFTLDRVREILTHQQVCLMIDFGRTIGAVSVRQRETELEVFAIAVRKEFQKTGAGSRLLQWAENRARALGKKKVFAHSYAFYHAQGFYEKNGFLVEDPNAGILTFYKDLK